MSRLISADEVAKHNTRASCWVILYGNVWDVTDFLPSHPGGASIVLKLAGRDATEEYDPIHPPGTLEENLSPSKNLGPVDPETLPKPVQAAKDIGPQGDESRPVLVGHLLNLDEIADAAEKKLSRKGWAYYYSAADDSRSKQFNNTVYQLDTAEAEGVC